MDSKAWKKPLLLEMPNRLDVTSVSSTLEAGTLLLTDWPRKRGPAFKQAVISCRDSLNGRVCHSVARDDFIAAAHEAYIYIQGETEPVGWIEERRAG